MLPDNSQRLRHLARTRHEETRRRAEVALASMPEGNVVTVARLATCAGVSRSWLYGQADLLDRIGELNRSRSGPVRLATDTRATTESNRRRLALAHDRVAQLTKENRQLRDAVARLHGQVREEAIRF